MLQGGPASVDVLAAASGVDDVQAFGERAHVRFSGVSRAQASAAVSEALARHGIRAVSIRPVAASLEDVFISLITKGETV